MPCSGHIVYWSLPGAGTRGRSWRRYPVVDSRLLQFVMCRIYRRMRAVGAMRSPKMLSPVGFGALPCLAIEVLERRFKSFLLV